jgi:hypothetical protein
MRNNLRNNLPGTIPIGEKAKKEKLKKTKKYDIIIFFKKCSGEKNVKMFVLTTAYLVKI